MCRTGTRAAAVCGKAGGMQGQEATYGPRGHLAPGRQAREEGVCLTARAREPQGSGLKVDGAQRGQATSNRRVDMRRVRLLDVSRPFRVVQPRVNLKRFITTPAKQALDGMPRNVRRHESARHPDSERVD